MVAADGDPSGGILHSSASVKSGTAQLAVHPGPIGHRALIGGGSGGRRKQHRFEPRVVEILG